jgi:hypothetical protein
MLGSRLDCRCVDRFAAVMSCKLGSSVAWCGRTCRESTKSWLAWGLLGRIRMDALVRREFGLVPKTKALYVVWVRR